MKLHITEEQLRFIEDLFLLESLTEPEIITESFNLKGLINKYKAALAAGVTATVILFAIDRLGINDKQKDFIKQEVGVEQVDSLRDQKINAVEKYIAQALKNQNFSLDGLQLSPEKIVDLCYEHNYDIPLLLAQGHQESCFGMTNRARRTNSVWSVGSYDNGKNVCTYANQNQSILPYINLMKKNYLSDKTIDELLTPGGFVDTMGRRYASDKNYENKIRNLRNKIIKLYPELA